MKHKSNLSGKQVFIIDGNRTPFLKARGVGPFSASDLAVSAGRDLLKRLSIANDTIDEVIIGCVMAGPNEVNISRVIAQRLGLSDSTPAFTVMRNCASGMQALDNAALQIASGRSNLILAGGTEAMSHAPILFNQKMANWLAAWASSRTIPARLKTLSKMRPSFFAPVIGILKGLTDPVLGINMGQTAENLAYKFDSNGKLYAEDNGFRADSSVEKLGKLKPFFDKKYGMVTAGNSSQITDGACLLLLASEDAVKQYKLPVLAKIVDSEWSGLNPSEMGLGPVYASSPILQRQNIQPKDLDCWEINEAFAAQVIACLKALDDTKFCQQELGLKKALGAPDINKLNIDGGAIALGHPVGASGARIVLHLAKTLQRNQWTRGMASICIGGGQGGAMYLERFTDEGPK